jgi:hypothetical protein
VVDRLIAKWTAHRDPPVGLHRGLPTELSCQTVCLDQAIENYATNFPTSTQLNELDRTAGSSQVTLRRVAAMLAKIPRAPSGLACMSTCPLRFIASHEATTEMFTRSSNRLGGALPEKEPRISQWRPFRMLLGVRIHVIPRLRARCKDIHRWVMDRGIVQAARLQTENIWQSLKFHDH